MIRKIGGGLASMDYMILKMEISSQDEDIAFYSFIRHEARKKKYTALYSPTECESLYVYKRDQII